MSNTGAYRGRQEQALPRLLTIYRKSCRNTTRRLASSFHAISNKQRNTTSQNIVLYQNNATIEQRGFAMCRQQREEYHRQDVVKAEEQGTSNQGLLEELICTISSIRNIILSGRTQTCFFEEQGHTTRSSIQKFGNFAVKIVTRTRIKHSYGDERREWHKLGTKRYARRFINLMLLSFEVDNKTMYLISQLGVCDLFQFVVKQKYTITNTAYQLIRQAVHALAWLHNQGYIHRDVKMENFILFPQNKLKLIDFEFTIYCGKEKLSTEHCLRSGTTSFLAPELITQYKNKTLKTFTFYYASDCYAFASSFQIMRYIISEDAREYYLEQFIKPMLRDEISIRATMEYIKNKLDNFLKQHDS